MNNLHYPATVEAAVDHWSGISPDRIKWSAYEEDGRSIVRLSAVDTETGRGVFVHMDTDDFRFVMRLGLDLAARLADAA